MTNRRGHAFGFGCLHRAVGKERCTDLVHPSMEVANQYCLVDRVECRFLIRKDREPGLTEDASVLMSAV